MWSRNASPVATLTRPRPSRTTFAVSCVSLDLRTTSALLLKPYLNSVSVRAQPFQRRKPHARVTQHLHIAALEAQDARALEERVDAQRRREARRARGRERVVGAGHIVTDGHGRIRAHEDRPRVLDPGRNARAIAKIGRA